MAAAVVRWQRIAVTTRPFKSRSRNNATRTWISLDFPSTRTWASVNPPPVAKAHSVIRPAPGRGSAAPHGLAVKRDRLAWCGKPGEQPGKGFGRKQPEQARKSVVTRCPVCVRQAVAQNVKPRCGKGRELLAGPAAARHRAQRSKHDLRRRTGQTAAGARIVHGVEHAGNRTGHGGRPWHSPADPANVPEPNPRRSLARRANQCP